MVKPLRVLHVVIDDHGGSQEYARRLCQDGDPRTVSSCVAVLPLHGETPRSTAAWRAIAVPAVILPAAQGPMSLLKAALALRSAARRADVVVTHTGAPGIVGRIAGVLAGRPVVHVAHNWPGALEGLRALSLGACDQILACVTTAVVAPSKMMCEQGVRHGWARPGRAGVIRYALDQRQLAHRSASDRAAARAKIGIANEVPVIAFCGRLDAIKGAEVFVAAARELTRTRPHLIALLAGDGPESAAVRRAAAAVPAVRLLGWRDDAPLVFQAADVACIPSRTEALGIVALEALAVGTPVVASRAGGLPEAVGPGGALVPVGDATACATMIATLLDDPARRLAMVKSGQKWVARLYGGTTWARRYERLWRRVRDRR